MTVPYRAFESRQVLGEPVTQLHYSSMSTALLLDAIIVFPQANMLTTGVGLCIFIHAVTKTMHY